jgi:hypothetical protein
MPEYDSSVSSLPGKKEVGRLRKVRDSEADCWKGCHTVFLTRHSQLILLKPLKIVSCSSHEDVAALQFSSMFHRNLLLTPFRIRWTIPLSTEILYKPESLIQKPPVFSSIRISVLKLCGEKEDKDEEDEGWGARWPGRLFKHREMTRRLRWPATAPQLRVRTVQTVQ